jgi:hypothetical protein
MGVTSLPQGAGASGHAGFGKSTRGSGEGALVRGEPESQQLAGPWRHIATSEAFGCHAQQEVSMPDIKQIKPNAEVIGADGVHVGTVDHVDGRRIKLTKKDSVDNRHHYIDGGLIADIENGTVRLSANGDVAVTLEDDA